MATGTGIGIAGYGGDENEGRETERAPTYNASDMASSTRHLLSPTPLRTVLGRHRGHFIARLLREN
jgi:hypothetical protein